MVTVRVDVKLGKIQWLVNGGEIASHISEFLSDREIEWDPLLCIS